MKKPTVKKLTEALWKYSFKKGEIEGALDEGFARLAKYHADVKSKADEILF